MESASPTARRANQFFLSSPKFPLALTGQISGISPPVSPDERGGSRVVTKRAVGCGGRGSVGRETESQGGFPVSDHRHADDGAEAYGKTVWSWHPLLVSSRRRRCQPDRVWQHLNPLTTVTRRIRRRGERGISRKAIAQGRPDALR